MPQKPNHDEQTQSEWMDMCIPMVMEDGSAESDEQAAAMCETMWQESKSAKEHMAKHAELVKAISERSKSSDSFGYGITTGEPYARALLHMEEVGCKTGRTASAEAMLKEASGRLCCALPEMVVEKFGTANDMGLGDIKTPPNTLMLIRHVLTSDRQDRDGDVLMTAGAMLDPKAPLLWQHQPFLPIGKVLKTIEHNASKLTVISALLDLNELTSDAAKLVEADALRFSHGFRAMDYEPLKSADGDEVGGFKVTKFEILEASLVSVPSNIDAEIELFSRGQLRSEFMKAHAKHHMSTRPVQVAGATLAEQETEPEVKETVADMSTTTAPTYTPPTSCTPADALSENTKAGRTLSAKNCKEIQEVIDDLTELAQMELPRAGKALLDRSVKRLVDVLEAANPQDEVDEDKSSTDIELPDVVSYVLGATASELARVKHTLDLVVNLDAYNAAGDDYRALVKQ